MPKRIPTHRPAGNARRKDDRASAAARGYGRRWRKLRASILRERPLCQQCSFAGRPKLATDVDHVRPKAVGEPGEWAEVSNLMPLCKSCHSRKTRAQQQG